MKEPLLLSPQDALPVMKELLKSGASCPILVTGNSMVPFLHHEKETVIVEPVKKPLKKGDIIFYERLFGGQAKPQVILHRVYRLTDYGCIALGDAQMKKEPVQTAHILGVVTQVRKNGKSYSEDRFFHKFLVWGWRVLYPLRPHLLRFFR